MPPDVPTATDLLQSPDIQKVLVGVVVMLLLAVSGLTTAVVVMFRAIRADGSRHTEILARLDTLDAAIEAAIVRTHERLDASNETVRSVCERLLAIVDKALQKSGVR